MKGFKPLQRDTSIANRFIGAALGLRVPQKKKDPPPSAVAPLELKVVDAWDD